MAIKSKHVTPFEQNKQSVSQCILKCQTKLNKYHLTTDIIATKEKSVVNLNSIFLKLTSLADQTGRANALPLENPILMARKGEKIVAETTAKSTEFKQIFRLYDKW